MRLKQGRSDEWQDIALTHPEGGRGLGVAEMAQAILRDRKSRADAELANHVLDIMHDQGYRYMPVIEYGKLKGLVSSRDILKFLVEESDAGGDSSVWAASDFL